MPGHSGRLTAAPILFKIADFLGTGGPKSHPPPAGALLVGRGDLPLRLQRLDPGPPPHGAGQASAPKIVYPPDGALLDWRGEEVPLEAIGGKQPFRWLVDGRPLPPAPARRLTLWQPDGVGFSQLTVIDAAGRSARSTVRLSP
jgi:penicillin-binding protein 1C